MGVANVSLQRPLFRPYLTVSLFLLLFFSHFSRECYATNVMNSLEQWLQDQLQQHAIPRSLYSDDDYYAGDDYTKTDDNDGSGNNINNRENKLLYTSPVDVSNFALKYTGCQNVQSWASNSNNNNDDDNKNNNQYRDSPLTVNRFVTLRLCPARKCSNYNSLGCQSEHAMDFLLPMGSYLDLLAAYQAQKMQLYCDVCTACDEFVAPTSAPTAAPTSSTDDVYDNANYMANSNYYGMDDDVNRKLADNNNNEGYYYGYNKYKDDDYYYASAPWYIADDGQTCKYSKVCENFQSVCKTSPPSFPTSSCTYTATAGTYVGPHCAADGSTIHRGMFHDASCSEYMGTYEDDETPITYNSNQCQDCNAARSYSLVSDDEVSSSASTNPLCGAVFDTAALCNVANVSVPLVTQQTGYYAYTDANVEHYVPVRKREALDVCTGELTCPLPVHDPASQRRSRVHIYRSTDGQKLRRGGNDLCPDRFRVAELEKGIRILENSSPSRVRPTLRPRLVRSSLYCDCSVRSLFAQETMVLQTVGPTAIGPGMHRHRTTRSGATVPDAIGDWERVQQRRSIVLIRSADHESGLV